MILPGQRIAASDILAIKAEADAAEAGLATESAALAAETAARIAAGGASGLTTVSYSSLGNTVPNATAPGSQTPILIYQLTDPTNLNDFLMVSLIIEVTSSIGTKFGYSLYAGNPSSGGKLLFTSPDTIITNTQGYIFDNSSVSTGYTYSSGASAYLLNAALRQGIYVLITNMVTSGFSFDIAANFLSIPPSSASLPAYSPASTSYTGPSGLTAVTVGPGQTFTEPAYAIPYMAAGFVMTVLPGEYFRPFSINTGMDGWTIQAAAGANADSIIFNGRGGFLTGVPPWIDNNSVSVPPVNPFRLAAGKGFITANSPGTVSGIGFLDCGGGYGAVNNTDTTMQSEAGIWWGPTSGACFVTRCVFNGGANGIFSAAGSYSLTISHCDFSLSVGCAQEITGHTHNVYLENATVVVTNSNFYAPLNGHAFKSRSQSVTATNCFFQAGSSSGGVGGWVGGRAVEMPDGGVGLFTSCRITQRADAGTSTNFIAFCDESINNGASSTLTFSGCTLEIVRYSSYISIGSFAPAASIIFTTPTETYYSGYESTVSLGYDPGGRASGVTGIVMSGGSGIVSPATLNTGLPAAAPSPAHLS